MRALRTVAAALLIVAGLVLMAVVESVRLLAAALMALATWAVGP